MSQGAALHETSWAGGRNGAERVDQVTAINRGLGNRAHPDGKRLTTLWHVTACRITR